MLIIVSDMAVDLLMNVLAGKIIGVLTNIGVEVLVDANVNVFVGAMAAFAFATSDPFEEFRC